MIQHFEQLEQRALLAGVTLITHGYRPELIGFPSWVDTMADAMMDSFVSARELMTAQRITLTNAATSVASTSFRAGTYLGVRETPTSELFLSLDWAQASNNFMPPDEVTVTGLTVAQTTLNYWLTSMPTVLELPMHLVGHSRGSSVVSELSRLLGGMGIWVDHVTYLDPHPLTLNDLFVDPYEVDPPARVYANVLFADNYWSTVGPFSGTPLPGAANLQLDDAPGRTIGHSETHAYYHGTADLFATHDRDGIAIDHRWYSAAGTGPRDQMGHYYSRLKSEVRTDAFARNGFTTLLGGEGLRVPPWSDTSVPQCPNVAYLSMVDRRELVAGELAKSTFAFSDRDSDATVTLYLDNDLNPYNGFVHEVASITMTQSNASLGSVSWSTAGLPAGEYALFARVTDGVRTRYAQSNQSVVITAPPYTPPHRLFFPEGYNGAYVNEYIPLINPNQHAVTYQVIVRYEFGDRDQVIASGTLLPTSRDGITVTESNNRSAALTRPDTPYAIEIRSSSPIGATMSHYDFGVATGEPFVAETSQLWHFPVVRRLGGDRNYIVWYNPTESDAVVTIRAHPTIGDPIEFRWDLGALRRGGININGEVELPEGEFSVTIECTVPIIASLSHYGSGGRGFIALGEPTTSAVTVSAPFSPLASEQFFSIVLFNPSGSRAEVTARLVYEDGMSSELPPLGIDAGRRRTFTREDLGILSNRRGVVSLTSTTGVAVTVSTDDTSLGDGIGSNAFSQTANGWLFADGFINPSVAGTDYLETLSLYNPTSEPIDVEVRYLFLSGAPMNTVHRVEPRSTKTLSLHTEQALLARLAISGQYWFGVHTTSVSPFAASMVHWDLTLRGGWQSTGTPMGRPLLI